MNRTREMMRHPFLTQNPLVLPNTLQVDLETGAVADRNGIYRTHLDHQSTIILRIHYDQVLSSKEVALIFQKTTNLRITPSGVDRYRSTILKKLGLKPSSKIFPSPRLLGDLNPKRKRKL